MMPSHLLPKKLSKNSNASTYSKFIKPKEYFHDTFSNDLGMLQYKVIMMDSEINDSITHSTSVIVTMKSNCSRIL